MFLFCFTLVFISLTCTNANVLNIKKKCSMKRISCLLHIIRNCEIDLYYRTLYTMFFYVIHITCGLLHFMYQLHVHAYKVQKQCSFQKDKPIYKRVCENIVAWRQRSRFQKWHSEIRWPSGPVPSMRCLLIGRGCHQSGLCQRGTVCQTDVRRAAVPRGVCQPLGQLCGQYAPST